MQETASQDAWSPSGILIHQRHIMQNTLSVMTGSPALQLTRDRALKVARVEFFAHSKGSSRILRLLSTKRKPVGYKALMDEVRFGEKSRDNLPASAIRAVLRIAQAAGLVRLTLQ